MIGHPEQAIFPFYSFLYADESDIQRRAKFIYDFIPHRKAEILEPNSGDGKLAIQLALLGAKVTALEKSLVLFSLALEKFRMNPAIRPQLSLLPIDLVEFDIEKKFDVIVLTNTLSYLTDDALKLYLTKARGLLNPGGILILNSPQPTSLRQEQPLQELTKKVFGENKIRHFASSRKIRDDLYEIFFKIESEYYGQLIYSTESTQNLHIRNLSSLENMLANNGFGILQKTAGWNMEVWTSDSPNMVLVSSLV